MSFLRCPLICLAAILTLSACTRFPDLDAGQTPGVAEAPYPGLLPLEALLDGPQPQADSAVIGQTMGRVGALQSRAARLKRVRGGGDAALSARVVRLRQRAEALRAAE